MDEDVILDYYYTKIYPSEYEKTVKNGGYIKMPYIHSKGPNLIYGGRKYKTETLFIVKSSSSDYDGELVIKHVPITNGDTSAYLIIPLKTRPTVYEETSVDKIINNAISSPFDFHLGELIGYNQTCKVNEDGTVFLLSPMLVKSSFDAFLPMKEKEWSTAGKFRSIGLVLQQGAASKTSGTRGGDGVEGFSGRVSGTRKAGAKSSSQYDLYDCEPILENDGKNKPTIEVMPVTSELAKNVGKMNAMNATIHFAIFLIMIILSGIATPLLYKTLFVDYISSLGIESDKRAASLKVFSYFGTAILLLFTMGISFNGMSSKDSLQSSVGAMMTIFIIISVAIMSYYKQIEPMTYSFGQPNVDFFQGDLWPKIIERLMFNSNYKKAFGLWGVIMMISIFMYVFGKFNKDKRKNKIKKNLILSYGFLFGSLFSVYVVTRMERV